MDVRLLPGEASFPTRSAFRIWPHEAGISGLSGGGGWGWVGSGRGWRRAYVQQGKHTSKFRCEIMCTHVWVLGGKTRYGGR